MLVSVAGFSSACLSRSPFLPSLRRVDSQGSSPQHRNSNVLRNGTTDPDQLAMHRAWHKDCRAALTPHWPTGPPLIVTSRHWGRKKSALASAQPPSKQTLSERCLRKYNLTTSSSAKIHVKICSRTSLRLDALEKRLATLKLSELLAAHRLRVKTVLRADHDAKNTTSLELSAQFQAGVSPTKDALACPSHSSSRAMTIEFLGQGPRQICIKH